MTSTDVDLTALRAAFPPEYVGKLPRVTCRACSDGRCGDHQKAKCKECDNYISTRHIHLDYVGHADVTIRLLDVDPEWTWAPKATDPDPEMLKAAMASGDPEIVRMVIANAPPKFETDRNGNPVGLWISLTVGGVTRFGVGSCPSNQNDAEKVLIGDALRNAAMRFGVAVDLWAKGDRADPTAENATASAGKASRGGKQPAQQPRQNKQQREQAASEPVIDEDAQNFADEAALATLPHHIEDIHRRAREAQMVTKSIRNPSSEGVGKLAVYLDWRRKQLEKAVRLDADDEWAQTVADIKEPADADTVIGDAQEQLNREVMSPEHFARINMAVTARLAEIGAEGQTAA